MIDETFDSVLDANHDGASTTRSFIRSCVAWRQTLRLAKARGRVSACKGVHITWHEGTTSSESQPASDASATGSVQLARPSRSSALANTTTSRDSSPRSSRWQSPPPSGQDKDCLHSTVPAQRKATPGTSPFAPGAVWQHGATPRVPVSHRASRNSHEYWHPPRMAPSSAYSVSDSSSPRPIPIEQTVELNSVPPPTLKSPMSAPRDFPGSRCHHGLHHHHRIQDRLRNSRVP